MHRCPACLSIHYLHENRFTTTRLNLVMIDLVLRRLSNYFFFVFRHSFDLDNKNNNMQQIIQVDDSECKRFWILSVNFSENKTYIMRKSCLMTCAVNKDWNQSPDLQGLIRVFNVHCTRKLSRWLMRVVEALITLSRCLQVYLGLF